MPLPITGRASGASTGTSAPSAGRPRPMWRWTCSGIRPRTVSASADGRRPIAATASRTGRRCPSPCRHGTGKDHKAPDITSDTAPWARRGTPPTPVRRGLVRDPDGRRHPQAVFSTNTDLDPAGIVALFVRRWRIGITVAGTRAHPGVETQRQWSDGAIARATPALPELDSLIALRGATCPAPPAPPWCSTVPQADPGTQRRHRRRSPRPVARQESSIRPDLPGKTGNSPGPPGPHGRSPLLRRMTDRIALRRRPCAAGSRRRRPRRRRRAGRPPPSRCPRWRAGRGWSPVPPPASPARWARRSHSRPRCGRCAP